MKLIKKLNQFDDWSIRFEERHPYIAGSICMAGLLAAMYGLLIFGAAYGY